MTPPAPKPHYDDDGNLALGWLIVARYDPKEGNVVISWSKDGDLYRQSKHGAVALLPTAIDEIGDALITTSRMLTSPSLL